MKEDKMFSQFISFVVRPPRAKYSVNQHLWEKEFSVSGKKFKREDLELKNERGHTLQCSHYMPSPFPEDTPLPCVIYCHGNSGCRVEANEAAVLLLPSNITVFALDFSGSGLSDGEYVSLGWHEKGDLKVVLSYLRSNKQISKIGLWGRSMGAVTSILYGAEDPSVAGMVLDSPFASLYDLMMELSDMYQIRLPKFTIKVGVKYMRQIIQKKADFDIMDLNCLKAAESVTVPALFGHANEDKFILPNHSDLIFKSYVGEKNLIKFKGDHNSARPQFFYDSVSLFFQNVLQPPQKSSESSSKVEKNCDFDNIMLKAERNDSKVDEEANKSMHYASILTPNHTGSDITILSDAPQDISAPRMNLASEDNAFTSDALSRLQLEDKEEDVQEACSSVTRSNTESCETSSAEGREAKFPPDLSTAKENCKENVDAPKEHVESPKQSSETQPPKKVKKTKRKHKAHRVKMPKCDMKMPKCDMRMPKCDMRFPKCEMKMPKCDNFDMLESLSRRLCFCVQKPINHQRHDSF